MDGASNLAWNLKAPAASRVKYRELSIRVTPHGKYAGRNRKPENARLETRHVREKTGRRIVRAFRTIDDKRRSLLWGTVNADVGGG